MKRVFGYLKPYAFRMSVGLFIKFTGTIMDLLIPWILSYIIDDVVPTESIPGIVMWGGIMVFCAFIAVVANIGANRMAAKVASMSTEKMRHDLFEKISYMSCKQTDTFTIPSLISRLTTDSYNIHQVVGMMQRLGVRAPILLIGGIMVTMTLEPVLTMVLVSTLPLLTVVVYFVSKNGIPLYTKVQESVDIMVRKVQEFTSGVRVIKALSKSEYENDRFNDINADVVKKEQKAGIIMSITNPVMNLLLNCGLTLVIVIGAYRVNAGLTQPGKIIAFLSYFTLILQAMMSITRMFIMMSKGAASARRIASVLEDESEIQLLPEDHTDSDYHIEFNNVNFSYNKISNNLTDINFKLKKGETLGIIGATGSGKSTIVNLLLRLYDIDSGEIRINGDNITGMPDEVLHNMFGMAFQNDFLFADTLKENIVFGRDVDFNELQLAAKSAQAIEFIESLNDKFEHELTIKGSNLSGGQKQRVLISRALADNPEILILDDSSSALDYKTDAMLRREIYENFKDTTTIIIAQRISSIMNSDHILMIDDGKCIGYGTHDELLAVCESYKEISDAQMGGEMYE